MGAGACARAFVGDCWEMFMNKFTHVCVWLFKSDTLCAHNQHPSSQRFEHGVVESPQRQLGRENEPALRPVH